MKILLPLLLILPLLVQSQPIKVDSFVIGNYKIVGDKVYTKVLPEPTLYKLPEVPKNIGATTDTLPTYGDITSNSVQWYSGSSWYNNLSTEVVKGKIETPINVMDSGMKVEVVETRDTIYKCPLNMNSYAVQYFNTKGEIENHIRPNNCTLDKIVTTRRYKLYIINEYGQKEYLSMELTKQK